MHLRMLIEELRPEEKDISRQAARMGLDISIERVSHLRWPFTDIPGLRCILIRIPSFFHRVHVSSLFELAGYATYNASWQLHTFGQKALACAWFEKHQLATIPTFVCFDMERALECARLLQYPVILKPSIGGFGTLVHWVESERELTHSYEYLETYAPQALSTRVVQKALDVKADIRILLLDGRILAVMERVMPGARVRNISRGGSGRPYELTQQERDLIFRLSAAMGPGFFGVDLLTDQGGDPYICEVNTVCRFAETARVTGVDVAGELLASLVSHMGR